MTLETVSLILDDDYNMNAAAVTEKLLLLSASYDNEGYYTYANYHYFTINTVYSFSYDNVPFIKNRISAAEESVENLLNRQSYTLNSTVTLTPKGYNTTSLVTPLRFKSVYKKDGTDYVRENYVASNSGAKVSANGERFIRDDRYNNYYYRYTQTGEVFED